eukprot:2643680-Heterocapsa_arctica.AAC.1
MSESNKTYTYMFGSRLKRFVFARLAGGRGADRLTCARSAAVCTERSCGSETTCGAGTPARRNKGEREMAAFGWHSFGSF